ncbi:MAG TPA: hypothetical protein VKM93_04585 [Terriglobia bacterium]|nr:hypothetical protein [Terriglobia bacterium]
MTGTEIALWPEYEWRKGKLNSGSTNSEPPSSERTKLLVNSGYERSFHTLRACLPKKRLRIATMSNQAVPVQHNPLVLVFAAVLGYPREFMRPVDWPQTSRPHLR